MSQQRLHTDIWHRARYQRILQFLLTSLLVEFTTLAASPALAGGLSASQVLALRAIAVSRPYGATILLYTLYMPAAERQGDLYLQRPLSEHDVDEQLEENAGGYAADLTVLTWNPYASPAFFLRVHWLRISLGHDAFILSTSTELVDQRGASLEPSHTIEPVTTALVSAGDISLLGQSSSM